MQVEPEDAAGWPPARRGDALTLRRAGTPALPLALPGQVVALPEDLCGLVHLPRQYRLLQPEDVGIQVLETQPKYAPTSVPVAAGAPSVDRHTSPPIVPASDPGPSDVSRKDP